MRLSSEKKALCCLALIIAIFASSQLMASPVALLAPARPHPEKNAQNQEVFGSWETDALISLMNPFEYENIDLDIPQSFAVWQPVQDEKTGNPKLERLELLGDLEEIRYLDKKAWGINVALQNSGANHFALETKPWWDENAGVFRQYDAKSSVIAGKSDAGWDLPIGSSLEILPLTRPFGLYSPCLFSGIALANGEPMAGANVRAGHINEAKNSAVSEWHETLVSKANENGEFSFIFNKPGWWFCEVSQKGEPLKGADGEAKDLIRSAVFWLYIDPFPTEKSKNRQR